MFDDKFLADWHKFYFKTASQIPVMIILKPSFWAVPCFPLHSLAQVVGIRFCCGYHSPITNIKSSKIFLSQKIPLHYRNQATLTHTFCKPGYYNNFPRRCQGLASGISLAVQVTKETRKLYLPRIFLC